MPTASDVIRELLLAAPKASIPAGKVVWPNGRELNEPQEAQAIIDRYNRALTAACDWLIRNP